MTDTILVLTEGPLADSDVAHILSLHDEAAYRVLVPADTEHTLADLVDQLSLGELRQALDTLLRRETPDQARAEAAEALAASLAAFERAGRSATGALTEDDPLPALRRAVAGGAVREVVVVTYPHAVEDTLHRDWASRAREALELPVLHLYAGTSELG